MTQPEPVAIPAGQTIDPTTHALAVPIYQTVAYGFDDAEHAANLFALKTPGNIYTRLMNPTTSVLEERVAALQRGVGALDTSCGAAAITSAVLNLARAGDNIVSVSTLYGGTYALFANTLAQFGIEARFVSPDDAAVLDGVVDEGTRLVFCESIGNPALNSSTSTRGRRRRTSSACRSSSTTPWARPSCAAPSSTARTSSFT